MLRAALIGLDLRLPLRRSAVRRGLGARRAALLTLAAFLVSAVALGLRPQLIGMALFAVVLLLVTDRRAHPGRLWAIPVLVLVWANIHGSFFLGPVVLGLAWLEDVHDHVPGARRVAGRRRRLGRRRLRHAVRAGRLGLRRRAVDQPRGDGPDHRVAADLAAAVPGIAVLRVGAGRRRAHRPARSDDRRGRRSPGSAVFFLIGAYAIRGVAWWPLGAVAAIAGVLVTGPAVDPARAATLGTPLDAPAQRRRRRGDRARRASPCCRSGDRSTRASAPRPGVVGIAPPGITAALRDLARPGDRLFNPQPWGSWFEFALPDLPVAIDSRIELFPASVWDAYESVVAGGDGWQAQLRRLGRADRSWSWRTRTRPSSTG